MGGKLTRRRGSDSFIMLGRQSAYGNRVGAMTDGSATKGEIAQYDGASWVNKGNLTSFATISALGAVSSGTTFPGSPATNDILIFSGAGSSLTGYKEADGTTDQTASVKGEVAQYTGSHWQERGILTTLSGISALGAVAAGTSFPASPANNAVIIFSAAADSLTGYAKSAFAAPPETTPAAQGFLMRKRFPFIRNTLDVDAEQTQSESIIGGGADSLNVLDTVGASGELECEVLPEDIAHLLQGLLATPDSDIVVTKVPSPSAIPDLSSGDQTIVSTTHKFPQRIIFPASATDAYRIRGFRRRGRSGGKLRFFEEVVPAGTEERTSMYFVNTLRSIEHGTGNTRKDFVPATSQSTISGLKFDSDAYETKLTMGIEQFEGWSSQMQKGGIPVTAFDIVPASGEFRIGSAGVRLFLTLLASTVNNYKMLTSDTEDVYDYNKTLIATSDRAIGDTIDADAVLTNYPRSNLKYYARWGGSLFFDTPNPEVASDSSLDFTSTEPTAFTDLVLGVNQNLESDEGITGNQERGQPIVGGPGVRQSTLSADIYVESGNTIKTEFVRWQDLYLDNKTARLEVFSFNYLDTGRQYMIHAVAPNCQLTTPPVLTVEGRSQMNRRLEWKLVPTDDSETNELTFRIYSEKKPF